MQSSWGKNVVYSLFGESHGTAIGITIHHLPAGFTLDFEKIQMQLDRRRPGKDKYATPRQEKDIFEIISGYFNDKTTGAPLTAIIKNTDQRSKDYSKVKSKMRPSHSDYAAHIKYMGSNDYRGGGHFSGRMTAPIVFAGAVAKQLLESKNIEIVARISKIGNINDTKMDLEDEIIKTKLSMNDFPVSDTEIEIKMKKEIEKAKSNGDSVGGSIEVTALNVPAGIGEPFFNSVESTLAHLFYSIPAVKGVSFGLGSGFIGKNGSEVNDEIYFDGDIVRTYSNNNGGITGGITNGMPIVSELIFKPTPTISIDQRMIDVDEKKNITDHIEGRHDPCIVQRAVPVVESMMAIGLLELFMDSKWSERWTKNDSY